MNYRVVVLPEAADDVDHIYLWISKRSPQGAGRWYRQFLETIDSLRHNPLLHAIAPENEFVAPEIRQVIFKTKRGLSYRALFRIAEGEFQVLHVRGPGQDLLTRGDLPTE